MAKKKAPHNRRAAPVPDVGRRRRALPEASTDRPRQNARSVRYVHVEPQCEEDELEEAKKAETRAVPAWLMDAVTKLSSALPVQVRLQVKDVKHHRVHADALASVKEAEDSQTQDILHFVPFFGGALAAAMQRRDAHSDAPCIVAAEALALLGPRAAPYAVAMTNVAQNADNALLRCAAIRAMASSGESALSRADVFGQLTLHDIDPAVRAAAALALQVLGRGAAEQAKLLASILLEDPGQGMRWRAAEALSLLGAATAPETSEAILVAALEDSSAGVRCAAAKAIAALEGAAEPCLKCLIAALTEDDARRRKLAAQALGIASAGRADLQQIIVERLKFAALEDSDYAVRFRAAESLGNQTGRAADVAVEELAEIALRAEKPQLQDLAAEALGAVLRSAKADELAHELDSAGEGQHRAAKVLGQLHRVSAPHLGVLARTVAAQDRDKPDDVRHAAACSFGMLSAPSIAGRIGPLPTPHNAALPFASTLGETLKSSRASNDLSMTRSTARALGYLGGSGASSAGCLSDLGYAKDLRDDSRSLQLEHRCSTASGKKGADVIMMRYWQHQDKHQQIWRERQPENRELTHIRKPANNHLAGTFTTGEDFRQTSTMFRITARTCLARYPDVNRAPGAMGWHRGSDEQ
eukprot:TRINITY_DN9751_c0_g1_i2.p1 TRINITY_DN9751_c0_g1~~TRINITY_DN9751_c0_g1_i2.p1  ORF type:complete len:642 (+),score=142.37 TRINITY_DN9751_c0_g1_i2:71-1996(+)